MTSSVKIRNLPKFIKFAVLLAVICVFCEYGAQLATCSPLYSKEAYHHKHFLGPEGHYTLAWKVQWETKSILFNVSAECKGYIGMGLSKTGSIAGSDFVIGGIDSSGKSYFSDMHGVSNGTLQKDSRHDWIMLDVHRGNGRIHLSFSRSFETCDDEDVPISNDLVHLIWAYGDTDEIILFSPQHGSESFYLLDPDVTTNNAHNAYREIGPHSNLYLMQQWRATARQKLSTQSNSQMCSIIKGRRLTAKHYIIGGGAYHPSDDSAKLIRQILLNRCVPPEGKDPAIYFDPMVKREGYECNSFQNSSLIPKHLCTETIFVWGYGGKPFYFPEEVGIPIGMSADEYFLLEIHYHNPENLENLTVKAGLELMIHPRPRKYEAGIQTVNYGLYGLFTIPPRSPAFHIYGHCSSQCTSNIFPQKGVKVLAVLFQMRGFGQMIRLRHFRGTEELPWILNDDNYEFTYQQTRLLSKKVSILPGDHLTLQCTYDTMMVPNTTFSGFSQEQEQCVAYLFVNQRASSAWCSSEYPMDNQLQYLGTFSNYSRVGSLSQRGSNSTGTLGKGSTEERGLPLADKNVQWSPSLRAALQREMLHGSQTSSCPLHTQIATSARARRFPITRISSRKVRNDPVPAPACFSTPFAGSTVTIPNISLEYRPASECLRKSGPANNFGYHRNVIGDKFKRNPLSNYNNPPKESGQKLSLKNSSSRFRRLENLG